MINGLLKGNTIDGVLFLSFLYMKKDSHLHFKAACLFGRYGSQKTEDRSCFRLLTSVFRLFIDARIYPVFSIIIFLSFSSCENDISKINLDIDYATMPIESSRNVRMILSDSAKVKVILTTPLLDVYNTANNPYFELKEGVAINFYNDSMDIYSKVTADYAIRHLNTGITDAKGNVVVINEKGEQLNTEHLTWNEKKQLIYTDDFVKISTADEIIYGSGLEANQEFSHYKITNIKGTINVKDEQNNHP